MNALQQRLAEYQNGGTFPDYQELMALAEKLHDDPEPARYVDVEKVMNLVVQVTTLATKAACSNEPISNECKNNISRTVAEIETLLATHELKRLSDEDVDSLLIDYNELILDRSHLSAPEAMQWIIRRVESKVRGEE